ncbi:tetratricopeptide repeat protein [Blastopirellula sp. JC732]|uniref:Tetratricopeptide repeat protein n=1 Tax=Blastopirellula sediminis TaxID=2894196 RepID=A0A9X1MLD6_9BACT|nr:tetratricopeptide repeat protein [Blastopirellula sediminis]MCC9609742.1 tetratricopeptide repeat protein [Blastopirellula sediminis]MCC9628986.1 tetratricopeptide repeat protein [Blastopirellula sediminis]
MRRWTLAPALWLLLLSPGLLLAQDDAAENKPADAAPEAETGPANQSSLLSVPKPVREAMQDRDYDRAITAIEKAIADKQGDAAYLTYLKGRAYYFAKKYKESIAVMTELTKRYPDSDWTRKARFAIGVAYARAGDYRAAELAYQAEAEYLISLERKEEIAAIYLEFADAFYAPKADNKQPDYQRALSFYQKAAEIGPMKETSTRIQLQIARCYKQMNNPGQAINLYQAFIKANEDDSLLLPARYELGEAYLAAGNRVESRRTWEDLLSLNGTAKSELIPLASFRLSETYGIPNPGNKDDLELGVAALKKFLTTYPDHEKVATAHLRIVQSYLNQGRTEDALAAVDEFLAQDKLAKTDEYASAQYLKGLALARQKKFDDAIAAWRTYLQQHPTHGHWSEAQRQIINAEYAKGLDAMEREDYDAARAAWGEFLVKYPIDERNRAIQNNFAQMLFQQKKYDEAIAAWRQVVSKYPQTEEASVAQYRVAQTLAENLNRLADAMEEYKKLNWGSQAGPAQQQIALLSNKSLAISTVRVYRSNETPRIGLKTRNLESVDVQIYKVDLETYFRKMHLATGVESLDIALIDPDSQFEHKVADYEKYRLFSSQVDVPLPGENKVKAGVMAITVSGKTQEATTLVLQSDLDMIVKSSRDEVFIFTQNMRTGKPWPGVKLLLSNGSEVFAEVETGADGVYQADRKELRDPADLRVFAIADGHIASSVVNLNGLGVAQGLARAGYLYTDRPAYRPGQLVHLKGIIRDAVNDIYVVPTKRDYKLEVYDGRNRLVMEEEIKLSDYGSFQSHLLLPSAAALGDYRIVVSDEKVRYEGSFVVHEYQLPSVFLSVESDRKVYYRGEKITGTIKAAYYYGAPVSGAEISYSLNGDRTFNATTDDKGEVKFEFETRDFRQSQTLNLAVQLPAHSTATNQPFFLSAQGYTIEAKTVRPVYLAGETFEVDATVKDAEGKPIAKDLTLKVFQLYNAKGTSEKQEKLVEEFPVKSDEKTGVIRKTLQLPDGGDYRVRLEGTDRFDNVVSGEVAVKISGEEDKIRLRILADHHTLKAGEKATVKVHWRERPALALLTLEGAKILEYRLIQLKKGDNEIEIDVASKLAPNFQMSLAVMIDPTKEQDTEEVPVRFHTATSPFQVERDLQIAMKILGDKHKPGDKIEVEVSTTNAAGQPVAAELSLAMVEKALYERFPERIAAIEKFFGGVNRSFAMRTSATIEFCYHPQTSSIDRLLLAEEERLETLAREEETLEELSDRDFDGIAMGVRPASDRFAGGMGGFGGEMGGSGFGGGGGGFFGGPGGPAPPMPAPAANQPMVEYGTYPQLEQQNRQLAQAGDKQQMNGHYMELSRRREMRADEKKRADLYFYDAAPQGGQGQLDNAWMMQPGELKDLGSQREVQMLAADGRFSNLNFAIELGEKWGAEAAGERLKKAAADGERILIGIPAQETGFWDPAVMTDKKGKTKIEITLPERSTAWLLKSRGVTIDTLAGEAQTELAVSKSLFGELRVAAAFVDGDSAQIPVTVHNDLIDKGEITVTLKTTIGAKSQTETKTLKVEKKGIVDLAFPVRFALPVAGKEDAEPGAEIEFSLTVAAAETTDQQLALVPLLPAGMPVYAIASGTSASSTSAFVQRPAKMPWSSPRMQIVIGPTVQQTLFDVLSTAPTLRQLDNQRFATGIDTNTSDLMAALALQQLMSKGRDASNPQMQSLDETIRRQLRSIVASQKDDGSWNWAGPSGASNAYTSSRAMWALSLARNAGYRVDKDVFDRGLNYLKNQLTQLGVADYESRAVLLHAVTEAGQEDFPLANQLYRNRNSLSTAGLAYLALTFAQMDRKETAGEIIALAKQKLSGGGITPLSWNSAEVETRGLYALCLYKLSPQQEELRKEVEWLMQHRCGARWAPEKAVGPIMLAVCGYNATKQLAADAYDLTVMVNDKPLKTLKFDANSTTQTLDVPVDMLTNKEKETIRFELNGRGEFSYECVLAGFVAADKLESTANNWTVRRYYTPAPIEFDGRPVSSGFGLLAGSYSSFRNTMTQLPAAKKGHVTLEMWRNNVAGNSRDQQMPYLIAFEPLPSGVRVDEKTVTGPFERFEIQPGGILFYLGGNRGLGTIQFDVIGSIPGDYQGLPTILRDAYHLSDMVVAKSQELKVLPLGGKSEDKYRLTPLELYELGRLKFDKHDYAGAQAHLTELFSNWNLQTNYFQQTVRMLLDISLEQGNSAEAVRYFEIVIEKYPELEIPFAKLMKIGKAYHEIGEYERAYLVYRATVEASFMVESQVAGFLQDQNEFLRSVEVMTSLLQNSPPEPYVATAEYALAQQVSAKAPNAAQDPQLKEKNINRVTLVRRSLGMLENFLTSNPEDPSADQAAFSLATGLIELDAYQQAISVCGDYTRRYGESNFLSSYWYITGFCHFALGQHEKALQMCEQVAEYKRPATLSGSRQLAEENKWRAVYIMGQIHHALGQAAAAITDYEKVKDRFVDAAQSIDYFLHKQIALADVSTFTPDEAVNVELKFRNIAACDVNVYRIDLMKFGLLRRNLQQITAINLAGIRPYHEEKVELGDGKDYRDRTKELKLPLKEEGAYLVVCRGENLHASGLVLISPLKVEVQEEFESGRVRATIRNVKTDAYVADVHVKVIGSANDEFVSGDTDLRGVFVADGIQGRSTILAEAEEGEYAFYRGEKSLGEVPLPVPNAKPQEPNAGYGGQMQGKGSSNKAKLNDELLRGIRAGNDMIQQEQRKNLDNFYRNDVKEGIQNFKF